MRLTKILAIVILGLTSSLAMAEEVDCSKLASPQARQQCVKQKSGAEVDCTNVADPQAKKECAQHKQQNSPDCSKLATPEARQACVQQKAK